MAGSKPDLTEIKQEKINKLNRAGFVMSVIRYGEVVLSEWLPSVRKITEDSDIISDAEYLIGEYAGWTVTGWCRDNLRYDTENPLASDPERDLCPSDRISEYSDSEELSCVLRLGLMLAGGHDPGGVVLSAKKLTEITGEKFSDPDAQVLYTNVVFEGGWEFCTGFSELK